MAAPPKYAKGPRPDTFARQLPHDRHSRARGNPSPDAPTLLLRITLGDMPLEDAFQVEAPYGSDTTLGGLLDATFPLEPLEQRHVKRLLDARANPDLPDVYDALVELLDDWRERRCDLRFYVNHGPELTLDARVGCWLAERGGAPRLLDLVMEQVPTPLEYAVHRGYAADATAILRWLEETAVLFFLRRRPGSARLHTAGNDALDGAIRRLEDQGRVSAHETGVEVTPQGERHVEQLLAEAESYAAAYDIFSDVLPGPPAGPHRFGAGRGVDLRVAVYEAEGVDPLRAVFLLRAYDSSLEEAAGDDWTRAATDPDFYRDLLAPVTDREEIDAVALEAVIDDGFAIMEQAGAGRPQPE